jgi:phospho-N-acetylmuramoyl-pentapeptide-transferase
LITLPFLISIAVALAFGDPAIRWLAARKARQPVSPDAPRTHQVKQGTPTMGGVLIIAAVVVTVLGMILALYGHMLPLQRTRLFAVLGVFVCAGGIGMADDLGKARKKLNKAGLSERVKLALQIVVAAGFVVVLSTTANEETRFAVTAVSVSGHTVDLRIVYYVLGALYLCGFGNAVNFTDGADGLASGTTLVASLALGAACLLNWGAYPLEMVLFYGAVAGACAGFLWFNAHPARVFMGDTGALALGMGLGAAALAAKQEILFLVMGAIFLAEVGSMMIQRYVFKYRRVRRGLEYAQAHRVFRRAPLHHHFEEMGIPETQVVIRFWIAALVVAGVGVLIAPLFSPDVVRGIGH